MSITPTAKHWPTAAFVDEALADPAWRPLPFSEYIIKVHGRCNLSCDYCYMYEMADQSWRSKPVVISRDTLRQTAFRIAEHLDRPDPPPRLEVTLHGGEPLLAGPDLLGFAAERLSALSTGTTEVRIATQTNAVLIDETILKTLLRYRIGVGVSLDGDRASHDRHRRYANGRGSYDEVVRGLDRLRQERYRHLYGGLLCTVDVANDPIDVYRGLLEQAPPAVDFLLPHGNWSTRPPGMRRAATAHADWLIAIFDEWYGTAPKTTSIRLFEEIISLSLGGQSRTEAVGLSPFRAVVIETDGTFELVDSMKSTFDGAAHTGLSVATNTLDEVMLHPSVVARQRGLAGLCQTCRSCPIVEMCGGGHFVHRYRPEGGFLNPSVYCADLYRLITHIDGRVQADLRKLEESLHAHR